MIVKQMPLILITIITHNTNVLSIEQVIYIYDVFLMYELDLCRRLVPPRKCCLYRFSITVCFVLPPSSGGLLQGFDPRSTPPRHVKK